MKLAFFNRLLGAPSDAQVRQQIEYLTRVYPGRALEVAREKASSVGVRTQRRKVLLAAIKELERRVDETVS